MIGKTWKLNWFKEDGKDQKIMAKCIPKRNYNWISSSLSVLVFPKYSTMSTFYYVNWKKKTVLKKKQRYYWKVKRKNNNSLLVSQLLLFTSIQSTKFIVISIQELYQYFQASYTESFKIRPNERCFTVHVLCFRQCLIYNPHMFVFVPALRNPEMPQPVWLSG